MSKKILFFIIVSVAIAMSSCSNAEEDDDNWHYLRTDTILVHDKKEYHFYPGTSIISKDKWYVITDRNGVKDTIEYIEGFENIYKEGISYLIIVQVSAPTAYMPDLYGYSYKLIKVLEEKKYEKN